MYIADYNGHIAQDTELIKAIEKAIKRSKAMKKYILIELLDNDAITVEISNLSDEEATKIFSLIITEALIDKEVKR